MSESQNLAGQIGRASAIVMIWAMVDKILTFSSFYRMILAATCVLGTGLIIVNLFEFASVSRLISVPIAATASSLCYLGIIWVFRTVDLNTCITVSANQIAL